MPKFIPGWQRAHRLWTIRIALVLFVLNLAGALMALLAEDFPSRIWLYLNTVLAAVIALVRVVQQVGALDAPGAGVGQAAALQPAPPSPDLPVPPDPAAADETHFRHPLERP